MEVKRTCPLGHVCEQSKDGYIERCMWYTNIKGYDAQGETTSRDECAIAWQPILLVDNADIARGQKQLMESARNTLIGAINGRASISSS